MKNNIEWKKRRIRYVVNNNIVGKIFMRLYYELEELIWLMVCIGLFVFIFKMFFFSF
jgi:hypothetical protein